MFPGVYGFTWDAGNVIFLGVFFTVAAVLGSTVVLATIRALRDMRNHDEEKIRWHQDFHDLPAPLRACRHEVAGEIRHRTCPNAFDCRACDLHAQFPPRGSVRGSGIDIGFPVPADRLYHRGHTWVKAEDDGTVLVGLDEFGRRVFGKPGRVTFPAPGTPVQVNGTGWQMGRSGAMVRILAPVNGVVVDTGSAEQGWFLRLGELRLGASLADGGELVNDLPAHYPAANWDSVWGEVFLEP